MCKDSIIEMKEKQRERVRKIFKVGLMKEGDVECRA